MSFRSPYPSNTGRKLDDQTAQHLAVRAEDNPPAASSRDTLDNGDTSIIFEILGVWSLLL
ncbi:uncharacterized protein PHALS_11800 [Plasmopara halstedii]|uniref:Uncharacterized protein n=1 Tax=Plasmopara halstedii TaxID=4781 RepID=A0A0P1AJB8_PLAHL|nr:uncharacterized protein PHALS_11800 [Plasmopara halstedii]CEG41455.1 hypothetical protein PHALS_11800 [Plasmopara halstedii]|eukprot:XP_024577824.1 hypothetical protein PHALS_11800 [Plasmopara halstedii]